MFSNWSLFYLGRLGDLSRRIEHHLAEARDRGNAHALAVTLVPCGALTWLARGNPGGARRAIEEARSGWSLSRVQLQHLWLLFAESLLDLYQRNGEEAWARMRAQWPRVAASLAMRVPLLRMQILQVRGSCALAAAVETRRDGRAPESLLREVERAARRLERIHMRAARPLALLLRSGAGMQRRQEDEAARFLDAAARGLERYETAMYAGAARRHLARLEGAPAELIAKLRELAARHSRWGYRRLHILLRREGIAVNHKRVYRLYRQEGLAVRRKRRKRLASALRTVLPPPSNPNERWSMDYVSDALAGGLRFRAFVIVDDFTRECLAIEVDTSIPGLRASRVFERIAEARPLPKTLVCDNGPEFTGRASTPGPSAAGSTSTSSAPGSRWRTPTPRASTGSFATSA